MAALDARRRQTPERQWLHTRVYDDRDALAERRRCLEDAERVAGLDLKRLDPEVTAPRQGRPNELRALRLATERQRTTGQAARQRRGVVDLEPELGQPACVAERVRDPELFADVAVELTDCVAGLEVRESEPRQDVAATVDEDREIDEVEEEREARRERRDEKDRGDDEELQSTKHPPRSRCVVRRRTIRRPRRLVGSRAASPPSAGRRRPERCRGARRPPRRR